MKILQLSLHNFRGFEDFTLRPRGHVVVMGEPRAGRSDLVEGLRRVLNPDSTRFPLSEPLDFYKGNTGQRAEVEVVIGDLGPDLTQRFFDQLEVWNSETARLVPELNEHDELPEEYEVAVRLCYRAEWDAEEQQGQHWVDFPKFSDAATGEFERARRHHREALPFATIQPSGRPLELSARSTFRKVVEAAEGEDFSKSLVSFEQGLIDLAADLAQGVQVSTAVGQVLEPIRPRLNIGASAPEIVQFLPEGGSLGAIIRSLGAAVDLQEDAGALPLTRHGSTLRSLFAVSEALYAVGANAGVLLADDFGEDMDPNAARHFAASLRARAGQVWLSTRRAAAAEPFDFDELIRMTRRGGERLAFQGESATTKSQRLANQHLFRQLLPEAASLALIISEGVDDRNGLAALSRKRFVEAGIPLPAAFGVSMAEAGGITEIPKLSLLARQLGFRTVALVDHDGGDVADEDRLNALLIACDAVVRLPAGFGIEKAILQGLEDQVIRDALRDLDDAYHLTLPAALLAATGAALRAQTATRIKSSSLHAPFVEALPPQVFPPVLVDAFDRAVDVAAGVGEGLIQLQV